MVALFGVFLGGLMVGRTPEYLGKTIGAAEAKLAALYALAMPIAVLTLTGIAAGSEAGRAATRTNAGPRAFSEILFVYSSCLANNGQAMGGLDAKNPFYNLTTIPAMLVGRSGLTALALALAGRLAAQGRRPFNKGTMPCDSPTFGVLVLGTMVLIGALGFLPGPGPRAARRAVAIARPVNERSSIQAGECPGAVAEARLRNSGAVEEG